MAEPPSPSTTLTRRRGQAFPRLGPEQVDRLRRSGALRSRRDGERLLASGAPGPGMFVVLKGTVVGTRPDGSGREVPVVGQGQGELLAETGQLPRETAFLDERAGGAAVVAQVHAHLVAARGTLR